MVRNGKCVKETAGIGWYRRRQERKFNEWKTAREIERKAFEAIERRARDIESAQRIRRYPIKQLSRAEFDRLPRGKDVDLKNCPLGTCFVCNPSELLPSLI